MTNAQEMKGILDRIEADIAAVKRQYDFFFQGTRRSEPMDLRREMEDTIRRMGQRRIINTNDQFRFLALQNRFYSLCNLWRRMVRDLEEGRLTRDSSGGVIRTAGSAPAAATSEPAGPAEARGPVDPEHLDRVLKELSEARTACSLPAGEEEIAAIRDTLLTRARDLSEKTGGKRIEFRVSVEDGKPKVKATFR